VGGQRRSTGSERFSPRAEDPACRADRYSLDPCPVGDPRLRRPLEPFGPRRPRLSIARLDSNYSRRNPPAASPRIAGLLCATRRRPESRHGGRSPTIRFPERPTEDFCRSFAANATKAFRIGRFPMELPFRHLRKPEVVLPARGFNRSSSRFSRCILPPGESSTCGEPWHQKCAGSTHGFAEAGRPTDPDGLNRN